MWNWFEFLSSNTFESVLDQQNAVSCIPNREIAETLEPCFSY